MTEKKDPDWKCCAEAVETCGGFNLRRTSRVVTQVFDEALKPCGLRSTQFVVLLMVVVDNAPSIAQLAEELVLEPSTMTRNLRPLVEQGLVQVTPGRGRAKLVRLTPDGRRTLDEALRLWKPAQAELVKRFGASRWKMLRGELAALTEAIQNRL